MRQGGAQGWHMIDEIDIVTMVVDHGDLAALCVALESCADALPAQPGPELALRLCETLERRVPAYEARMIVLLAALFGDRRIDATAAAGLDHIRSRCAAQVVQGQDLAAALRSAGGAVGADTLGYMLRCFFEGCRADMAFQTLAILHFSGNRLTAAARTLLSSAIAARCIP